MQTEMPVEGLLPSLCCRHSIAFTGAHILPLTADQSALCCMATACCCVCLTCASVCRRGGGCCKLARALPASSQQGQVCNRLPVCSTVGATGCAHAGHEHGDFIGSSASLAYCLPHLSALPLREPAAVAALQLFVTKLSVLPSAPVGHATSCLTSDLPPGPGWRPTLW